MKRISIYLVLITLLLSCSRYTHVENLENPDNLFPVGVNGKWGYVDSLGNEKIITKFEESKFFKDGLATVKFKGRYGYINSLGKWVIKPKFEEAGDFYLGCATVRYKQERINITKSGKVNKNCKKWGLVGCLTPLPPVDPMEHSIKKGNKYALTFKYPRDTTDYIYDSVQRFSRSFILVSIEGKWGFHYLPHKLSKWKGVPLREPIYDEVKTTYQLWRDEVEDGAIRYAEVRKKNKWCLINAYTLEEISGFKYYSMDRSLNRQYILVQYEPNLFGYIDYKGNEYFKR